MQPINGEDYVQKGLKILIACYGDEESDLALSFQDTDTLSCCHNSIFNFFDLVSSSLPILILLFLNLQSLVTG